MSRDDHSQPQLGKLFEKKNLNHSSFYSSSELFLLIGSFLLLIMIFIELYDWQKWLPLYLNQDKKEIRKKIKYNYGYEDDNGPAVWKHQFLPALGNQQSPINIVSSKSTISSNSEPLTWSASYANPPDSIRISNDGHCVVVHAKYVDSERPHIKGGPLGTEEYELHSIRFRWGACDDEGSEHTIDFRRFALELQAIHVKPQYLESGAKASRTEILDSNVAIISYLFQTTPVDNHYMEPIVSNLKSIVSPGTRCSVAPFPLCWLMPAFGTDYYTYSGSLTHPPCIEGIIWMIQPEPLAISSRQVRKFRNLLTRRGQLLSNTRPIQSTNDRMIEYFIK